MALQDIEKYEWLVYVFDGITLIFMGLFFIGGLIGVENNEKTLPTLVASLVCLIMSVFFFSEAYATKNRVKFTLDFSIIKR